MATFRRSWFHARGIAVLAALCLVSALAMAAPASATTPGKNGRIAFKGYLDADNITGAIFRVWPDGTHGRQITFAAVGRVEEQTEVAFLPDGRRIVFTRSFGRVREFPNGEGFIEHSDIVIRDLSGRHTHVVLRGRPFAGDNINMVVSPDGTRIAFQRHNSPLAEPAGGIAVFVMRINGTHLRRITPWSLRAGDHPDWSPDGRWILFRSNEDGGFLNSQLYVIHPDGSGMRQITHLSADTMLLSASFSPNGARIVFSQTGDSGQPDIFTMRVDGSDVHQVTRTPLWESAPDWGSRAH